MPRKFVASNIGAKGLSTDILPWELPPEFITSGKNFRIFAGSIRTAGGSQLWAASPTQFNPGHVLHVGATSGEFWMACGRGDALSGLWTYSTPATFAAPTAGQIIHSDDDLNNLHVSVTDDNAANRTTDLLNLEIDDSISNGNIKWKISSITNNTTYITYAVTPDTQDADGQYSFDLNYAGGVYVYDGGTWSDISSATGYKNIGVDDELLWTSCMLGQIPLINNPQATVEYWSPQGADQILRPLNFDNQGNTWDDLNYTFNILRSHKNYLFAFDLQEGGIEYPDTFRWSHPADINGLPVTWDETDDAYLAGRAALGGDGGRIIDGRSLRDAMCIYSENSIDVLDFTNDEFVWRRRELSATVGLLARNSMIEVKGKHFFLADGDIVMNDGTSISSIAHNRIRKQLNAGINVNNDVNGKSYYSRSYAVRNDSVKEVWFCVPEEDATYPNIAYIYNWKDDSWAIRDLPYTEDGLGDTQTGIAFAGYGSQTDPIKTWDANPDNNIVDDGGFVTGTDWVFGTGWSLGYHRAECDGSNGTLTQAIPELTSGDFDFIFDIKDYVSGSVTVQAGSTGTPSQLFSGNGTYSVTVSHSGSTDLIFDSMAFEGSIANVYGYVPGTVTETWDAQQSTWGSAELSPLDDTIIGCDSINSTLTLLDPFGTPDDNIDARIERTDFPLDGHDSVRTITRVYPHMTGTQPVLIQIGSQDFAGAPVRWKPAIEFNPDTDRKVDVRSTGELHCWRVDSVGKGNWQMSGMTIEYEMSGKR